MGEWRISGPRRDRFPPLSSETPAFGPPARTGRAAAQNRPKRHCARANRTKTTETVVAQNVVARLHGTSMITAGSDGKLAIRRAREGPRRGRGPHIPPTTDHHTTPPTPPPPSSPPTPAATR